MLKELFKKREEQTDQKKKIEDRIRKKMQDLWNE